MLPKLAGLELLTSGDPPTSTSQSAEIIGMSHCFKPRHLLKTILMLIVGVVKRSLLLRSLAPPSPNPIPYIDIGIHNIRLRNPESKTMADVAALG